MAKRIKNELKELLKQNFVNCTAVPDENDLFHWYGTIIGPSDTPYEGGIFKIDIIFPPEYPFDPPSIKFITPIYHCNISERGLICLDILKKKWSPILTISKVLLSLCSLLSDPNPDDPLRNEIAREYKEDKIKHDEIAKRYTLRYASN